MSGMNIQSEASTSSPVAVNPHRRINAETVRGICADISNSTLTRWLDHPTLNFPQPVKICEKRFWKEVEVLAWWAAQEARK